LDVGFLLDHEGGVFKCEVCSTELEHNDNAENVKGSEQLHGRYRPWFGDEGFIRQFRINATRGTNHMYFKGLWNNLNL